MASRKKEAFLHESPVPSFDGFPKEAFKFLHGLKKNNSKDWFEEHRSDYEFYLREPSKALAHAVGKYFLDHDIPAVGNAKVSLFRIHRDIRFSKDKSPYKTHIGLNFPLTGSAKEEWCGFYVGFEPAGRVGEMKGFAGGGVYMPMAPQLKRIRAKIADDPKTILAALNEKYFKKLFPKGLTGESLKRMPVGYDEAHPAAELLKLKSFVFSRELSTEDLSSEDLAERLGAIYETALPVVRFLASA